MSNTNDNKISFTLTESERIGLRMAKLRAIAKKLVARHNCLKNPEITGQYGQDDELFNYLDQLDQWFKDNPNLKNI